MKNERVLVTGGAGFIGSNLAEELAGKNEVVIIEALGEAGRIAVFPVHPRTEKYLVEYRLPERMPGNEKVVPPIGYLDMLMLMNRAEKILTDFGGIQKEAYILRVPCITLRENTEWLETLEGGWNVLVGADRDKIIRAVRRKSILGGCNFCL
jgi:UDP-N-acetylglucosamine 2-epimerase (non-hydrolysing)